MLKYTNAFSGFSVDNLEKAKAFYVGKLGLTVTENPMGLLELHIDGNQPMIVYPKPNHEPATFTILNFKVRDIEKTVDELIEKGVVFEQYNDPIKTNERGILRGDRGPAIAWFKDPAGNILSIIEERD
jgi:catechol 2,3-dioxygenase-like lactoylglutathione lyase family enzyme